MDYDPHFEEDQLEKQQTKEILETELTKVILFQWMVNGNILPKFLHFFH